LVVLDSRHRARLWAIERCFHLRLFPRQSEADRFAGRDLD
jgi:hypothetical protein